MTDNDKPVSIESEQALIGAVLRGGRVTFEKVREFISTEYFWSASHQAVWKGIGAIYDNGMQIDVIVLGDEMERMLKMGELEEEFGNGVWNGRAYLGHLRTEGDPRNVETYAEQVQDYHIKRHLQNYSAKLAYWSANGRRGKDIIADVEAELSKITLYNAQDEYTVTIKDAVSKAYDWTDRAAKGELMGIKTGLLDVDRILGSLIAGNVYIVAGRPGTGKTAWLLSVARYAALKDKKRVGIFSLEMSQEQIAMRLISQYAEIDLQGIIQGTLHDGDWAKYTHGVEVVADLPIVVNDLSSINIAQIRHTARKIKASGGLDLLVVDYIQLATGTEKHYQRRDLEISEVSRGLKYLARELNVPILAAAQLNRAVEQRAGKRPVLSDLRESGSLEQDAYCVMFLYKEDDESDVIKLDVAKHRNGPVGMCDLIFRAPCAKFENAAWKRMP